MATEKTIQIRGSSGAAFRRIERTFTFLGKEFTVQLVRVDPTIEHAIRVESGEKEFSGTLLIDKDNS